jgi:hypothetical protein
MLLAVLRTKEFSFLATPLQQYTLILELIQLKHRHRRNKQLPTIATSPTPIIVQEFTVN